MQHTYQSSQCQYPSGSPGLPGLALFAPDSRMLWLFDLVCVQWPCQSQGHSSSQLITQPLSPPLAFLLWMAVAFCGARRFPDQTSIEPSPSTTATKSSWPFRTESKKSSASWMLHGQSWMLKSKQLTCNLAWNHASRVEAECCYQMDLNCQSELIKSPCGMVWSSKCQCKCTNHRLHMFYHHEIIWSCGKTDYVFWIVLL